MGPDRLPPEWLTKNVYALMRKAEKLNGLLKREDIDKMLYRIKDQAMRDYLVRIMERFEIAYTRPTARFYELNPRTARSWSR